MFEVRMPQLGLTMEEGTIANWLKAEGDTVEVGDILCEVETDKLTNELPSEFAGVLRAIVAPVGEDVPVLGLLALIGSADEPLIMPGESAPAAPGQPESAAASAAVDDSQPATVKPSRRIRASGLAKKIAAARGIDLTDVIGSGPGGRIVARDVEAVAAAPAVQVAAAVPEAEALAPEALATPTAPTAPVSTEGRRERMTGIRRTIARRMTESWTTAPVVTYDASADTTALTELKNAIFDDQGKKVSYTHLLAALVTRALLDFPLLNSSVDGDDLVFHDEVNLGIAVAIPEGLVVPVVKDAQRKGIGTLADEISALVNKAKNGELDPGDMQGGTFTITNLGMFGIESFSPIINMPEVAILGVNATVPTPVEIDGKIVLRPRMKLSLTADHRAVDGAVAAQFLSKVCALIEKPWLSMM